MKTIRPHRIASAVVERFVFPIAIAIIAAAIFA